MRQRWVPVAVLAGLLFVINAVARLVVWGAGLVDQADQTRIGLITFAAIGAVCVGAAAWWAVRHPLSRAVGDLLVAGSVGCLLSVLVGPFFGGSRPFAAGVGFALAQVVQYMLLAVFGALVGVLAVTAFGRDWKTRVWKRQEAALKAKGHRASR
jgi:hypothetical protein